MTIRTAVDILILAVLVLDLLITYGLVLRLRALGTTHGVANEVDPPIGLRIDPGRDSRPWTRAHRGMLVGSQLVLLVVPGCGGCSSLREEMARRSSIPAPVWVLADPGPEGAGVREYLDTWTFADQRLAAPDEFHLMASMERPEVTPVIMLLRDGVVVDRGHRYRDLDSTLQRLATS